MNSVGTLLVCEDGRVFYGTGFGASGDAIGELIASTSMTGYQETLTAGQSAGAIVLFTTPHIGNVGVNEQDGVTPMRAAGVILRETPRRPSNWRATGDLDSKLKEGGTVGIAGLDTRALMRHLQHKGNLKVGIFTADDRSIEDLHTQVQQYVPNTDRLISSLTSSEQGSGTAEIGVVDLGQGSHIARNIRDLGYDVSVFLASVTAEELHTHGVQKVILSSGPGNPADATSGLGLIRDLLEKETPLLGIGLGHQLLARALGYATRELNTPHNGANHPVKDVAQNRVFITSHAHAYTVEIEDSPEVTVTHINLNDQSVEGFRLNNRPVYGIQFALGTRMGPTDANHLLDSFLKDA